MTMLMGKSFGCLSQKRICFILATMLLLCMSNVSASASSSSSLTNLGGPSTTMMMASSATGQVQQQQQTEGGNVIFQFVGYIKDSVVRTVDGCREMTRNHRICNGIRAKQRDHREHLRLQWEATGDMSREDVKKRLQTVNGGITYEEYSFLSKGKDDRSKLMTILLMMWGAPRFLPYALMLYPDMLPSPFETPRDNAGKESRFERFSRERSHAVLKTLVQLERDAKIIPAVAKLNIFGRNKQQSELVRIDTMNHNAVSLLTSSDVRGSTGAGAILQTMEKVLYSSTEHTRGERCLVTIPKAIIQGLQHAIDGTPNLLNSVLPNFVTRGKVLSHIRKITEGDEFLVHENIHLDTLGRARLIEACDDRLMCGSGLGRSDDELRESLQRWLEVAVKQPEQRCQQTGEHYNGNVARAILMCYHAMDSVRDARSTSFLPRLLLQSQQEQQKNEDRENGRKGKFF